MNKVKAFTLIELLVVVAIIGILATVVVANVSSAQNKARDAKVKADLGTVQKAASLYFMDKGNYTALNCAAPACESLLGGSTDTNIQSIVNAAKDIKTVVSDGLTINSSSSAYQSFAKLPSTAGSNNASAYCIDSTGKSGSSQDAMSGLVSFVGGWNSKATIYPFATQYLGNLTSSSSVFLDFIVVGDATPDSDGFIYSEGNKHSNDYVALGYNNASKKLFLRYNDHNGNWTSASKVYFGPVIGQNIRYKVLIVKNALNFSVYIDGIATSSFAYTSGTWSYPPLNRLRFAAQSSYDLDGYTGDKSSNGIPLKLYDVRIYNRAVNATEASDIANHTGPTSGLAKVYSFGKDNGINIVNDLTSNNDGILAGSTWSVSGNHNIICPTDTR